MPIYTFVYQNDLYPGDLLAINVIFGGKVITYFFHACHSCSSCREKMKPRKKKGRVSIHIIWLIVFSLDYHPNVIGHCWPWWVTRLYQRIQLYMLAGLSSHVSTLFRMDSYVCMSTSFPLECNFGVAPDERKFVTVAYFFLLDLHSWKSWAMGWHTHREFTF